MENPIHITKPDFHDVRQRWNAFWQGELLDRPLVCAITSKDDGRKTVDVRSTAYWNACQGQYAEQLDLLDEWVERCHFHGDQIPWFSPDHGPDQFAAWLGSQLKFCPGRIETNWAEPILEDWERFLPIRLDEENACWKSVIHFAEKLRERGRGKYIVGMADLHSHMDAFSALRHPGNLCMDLYDEPELVKTACEHASAVYPDIYERIYEAGGMSSVTGTIGWLPLWCEGRSAVVQCDFSVFLSNKMWREFVLPGIEREVDYLDHCFYHLDGVQQLNHLGDLLALPKLDGIQWVPGAGQPEMFSRPWRDVLKKILGAGKKIIVYGDMDLSAVQDIHRDLGSRGIVYEITGQTFQEIEAILHWLKMNT